MPISYSPQHRAILEGKLENLPKFNSRIVRIFLSSTFTDTELERNIILKELYPHFRSFCESLKLEFQLVDMRWGIKDEANLDHSTEKICLREIRNCVKYSAGPNFVVFLCDKYGYDPVRTEIPRFDYMSMETIARNNGIDFGPISTLYKLDENNLDQGTGMYIPLKIPQILPDIESRNSEKKAEAERQWKALFMDVQKTLQQLANKKFSGEQALYYQKSVTEAEVRCAFVDKENQQNKDWCILFTRKLKNVNKFAEGHTEMTKYLDFDWFADGSKRQNLNKQKLLENLKKGAKAICPPENHFDYEIEALETGMDINHPEHRAYLDKFKIDFTESVKRLILKHAEGTRKAKSDFEKNPLLSEIVQHAHFCNNCLQHYFPRPDITKKIFDALKNFSNLVPIVVFGDSGSGKTSMMASIVHDIKAQFNLKAVCIYRFLGTTAATVQISTVLKSITAQLRDLYPIIKIPDQALEDFAWLCENFVNILEDISRNINHELVIILDSVDELSSSDGAHKFIWLPRTLPAKVRMILTVDRMDINNCLDTLTLSLNRKEHPSNFINVPAMPSDLGEKIIDNKLASSHRKLQSDQKNYLLKSFKSTGSPLYLKLALEDAMNWHSFTKLREMDLARSTFEMIERFLEKLEKKYGSILVKKALSYLVSAKFGLSEGELEDILSLDNDVLNELYQYWPPPDPNIVRIPPMAWSRVKHELTDQLVERLVDRTNVLSFLHKQFPEVIEKRYMSQKDILFKIEIHKVVSEYFEGTYGERELTNARGEKEKRGTGKEIVLFVQRDRGIQKLDRKVRAQPEVFSNGKFNLRKLNELPFHYIFSGNVEALIDNVLSNYDWLITKIRALSVQHVIEDFNEVLLFWGTKVLKDLTAEVRRIRDCLRLCKPALGIEQQDQKNILRSNNFAHEFLGRMNVLEQSSKGPIRRILERCRSECESREVTTLIPANTCYPSPSRALRCSLFGHKSHPTCVTYLRSGVYLLSGSTDKTVRVWDTETDELALNFDEHKGAIRSIATIEYANVCASVADDSQIFVWDIQSGEIYAHLEQDVLPNPQLTCHLVATEFADANCHYLFCAAKQLKVWDLSMYYELHSDGAAKMSREEMLKKCNTATLKEVFNSGLNVTKLKVSIKDRYFAVGYDSGLMEVYGIQRLKLSGEDKLVKSPITDMAFSHDENKLFYSSNEGVKCLALNSNSKTVLWNNATRSITLSQDGKFFAAGGGSGAGNVFVWNVDEFVTTRAQPMFSVDHTSFVGKCDIMDVRFCRNNDFVVSVSLSRNMGSGGVTDFIDKSLIVATPIYSIEHDSIILDGLTGICTGLSVAVDTVAACSNKSSAIKIFQVDREWGEMMRRSNVFIYRNPSYLEEIRSDGTVFVKCGQDLLVWQEGHNIATKAIRHGHTLTCLAAGPDRLIASGDHQGVLCLAYFKTPKHKIEPQVIEAEKSNYDIHAIAIDNSESRVAALHNMGDCLIYARQPNGQFKFSKLVKYPESYANVTCMYFAANNFIVFGAKNCLRCFDINENKLKKEISNLGKEIALSAINKDGTNFAAVDVKNDKCVYIVPLVSNSVLKESLELFAVSGDPTALCFGGEQQDCLIIGSADSMICVYSIVHEDILTFAFVYDQPTRLIYRNGIIYSGMKNGQFAKFRLVEKTKPVVAEAKQKQSENLKQKRKFLRGLLSAEELFTQFRFQDEDKSSNISVKPRGLQAILKPNKKISAVMERNKQAKFHKMSAAIISPDEIAAMAKREEERKKKLEAKFGSALYIHKVLAVDEPKTTSSKPPMGADRQRKSFVSFAGTTSPTSDTQNIPIPDSHKFGKFPDAIQEIRKEHEATNSQNMKYGKQPPKKDKTASKDKKQSKTRKTSRGTFPRSVSDLTPSVGQNGHKDKSVSNGTGSNWLKEAEDASQDYTFMTKSLSVDSFPKRKISPGSTKLPYLELNGVSSRSRKISKAKTSIRERSDLLKSVMDQYEESSKLREKLANYFQPKLPGRKIETQPFSFHSRPISRANTEIHQDCYPVLFEGDPEYPDNEPNFSLLGNSKSSSGKFVRKTENGISLRHPSTFELRTYYPIVWPRTKTAAINKHRGSPYKEVHRVSKVHVAPTRDFFDTELTTIKPRY